MKTVPLKKMKNIAPLFSWSDDKLIDSCIQGHSGQAFADDPDFPTVALIVNIGFSFIGGNPASVQAVQQLNEVPIGTELIPQPNWYDRITSYNVCYTKLLRKNSRPHNSSYRLPGSYRHSV